VGGATDSRASDEWTALGVGLGPRGDRTPLNINADQTAATGRLDTRLEDAKLVSVLSVNKMTEIRHTADELTTFSSLASRRSVGSAASCQCSRPTTVYISLLLATSSSDFPKANFTV